MVTQATATHAGHDRSTQPGPVPADGRYTRHVRLAALPSAVPWARRVLRHMLREWEVADMADPAALLVSELVTNAVQASADSTARDQGKLPVIGLAIRLTAASLVLEVWDPSPRLPVRQQAGISADHGRGLVLVDALADSWGHRAAEPGKVVWCELAIPSPSQGGGPQRSPASPLSVLPDAASAVLIPRNCGRSARRRPSSRNPRADRGAMQPGGGVVD